MMDTRKILDSCEKSAKVSLCGQFRYTLTRTWDTTRPLFLFIGINPSTADAVDDDQTVKKWTGFTAKNGGGGFVAVNVFAYRSTDPAELAKVRDPVGPANTPWVEHYLRGARIVVPCWGRLDKVPARLKARFSEMESTLLEHCKTPLCLGVNADGTPKHPQMLGYDTPLQLFTPKQTKEENNT